MSKTKITIIVIVVIAVLGAAAWYLSKPKQPVAQKVMTKAPTVTPTPGAPLQVTKTLVPDNTLPQDFPSDLPLEAGATVTQNYNASSPGLIQATRVFDSQKSMLANFQLYFAYLRTGGWSVGATLNNDSTKVLAATKGQASLEITITPGTQGANSSSVSISYSADQ